MSASFKRLQPPVPWGPFGSLWSYTQPTRLMQVNCLSLEPLSSWRYVRRKKQRKKHSGLWGRSSAVSLVCQRHRGEWGPNAPKVQLTHPWQRFLPRKTQRSQGYQAACRDMTVIQDSLKIKGFFLCNHGIPGPCEILKWVGVGELTVTGLFSTSLWGGSLKFQLMTENKNTHHFLHTHTRL